jgi:hypothetical protein
MGSNQYKTLQRSDTWHHLISGMAADPDWEKRWRAANQIGINITVLRRLAGDPDPVVRGAVLANPACDANCLSTLVSVDPAAITQVVGHDKCPPQLLNPAASSTDAVVRLSVAKHHNTPPATLIKLLADQDATVRAAAMANPNLPEEYRRLAAVSGYHVASWRQPSDPGHVGTAGQ